jgi:hypothetical protein
MVLVEIQSPAYDEEAGNARLLWRATVKADGDRLEIHGEEELVAGGEMPVMDPFTGQKLSSADDPEMWARSLPYAFRAGDLMAVVVHDDSPVHRPEPDTVAPSETPDVPVTPPRAHRVAAGSC